MVTRSQCPLLLLKCESFALYTWSVKVANPWTNAGTIRWSRRLTGRRRWSTDLCRPPLQVSHHTSVEIQYSHHNHLLLQDGRDAMSMDGPQNHMDSLGCDPPLPCPPSPPYPPSQPPTVAWQASDNLSDAQTKAIRTRGFEIARPAVFLSSHVIVTLESLKSCFNPLRTRQAPTLQPIAK